MTESADAVIIGAGIHGASLAFHLTRKGLKPLVLERRTAASGATGRSSGLVRMHYDLEPEAALAWVSYGYFRDWAERVGGDCGFTRTGFVQIVAPKDNDRLRANVAMQQRLGIPTLLVRADDVGRIAPGFRTDDFELAAFEPESGYADPSGTAAAFLASARERGARLTQETEVVGIEQSGGRVTGVRTDKATVSTPIVVNAAGAWAAAVGRLAGLELPITTWRHDTAYLRRPPELGPSHPTVIDFINLMYFRPETGGLTLVGLEDGNPQGVSPDSGGHQAQPDFVERAVDRICRRLPGMDRGSLHSASAGYDGLTTDQRAILDQAGPGGHYLVCGFSGTGFKIAPAVGACMAEWIVDGRASTVDISAFTLKRFDEGRHLQGDHAYGEIWQ